MQLDFTKVRVATDHPKTVGGQNLSEAQEQAWGGPLEIYKHVTLGGLISDGLQRALADCLDESNLQVIIPDLREAATNDYIQGVAELLEELGFLVDAARRPADQDEPYVWARVKENFGEERALRDRISNECRTTRKVRARKMHDCTLCLQYPAIEPGDIYHAYTVYGEGMVKVCMECVSEHDLPEMTWKMERKRRIIVLLSKRRLIKWPARRAYECVLCERRAIKRGDSYYFAYLRAPKWFEGAVAKVCGGCFDEHALTESGTSRRR